MARIRTIKPEFWEDECIGILSRDARLLFIATWNLADDEGLLRWSPDYLKANVFMYDDDITANDVATLMAEVADAKLVYPYNAGRAQVRAAFIVSFRKHQRIDKPQPGKLAPPSLQQWTTREMYARRDNHRCHICGGDTNVEPRRNGNCYDTGFVDHERNNPSPDHVVPRSQGGSDYPSNIRNSHLSCNKGRGDRPLPYDDKNDSKNDSKNHSATEGKGREGKGNNPVAPNPRIDNTSPPQAAAQKVFDAWIEATGKTGATKYDHKRRRLITNALKQYPLDDVLDAVQGWRNSPHHRGENDRGTTYNDLELLLRDAAHIEKFRDLNRQRARPPTHAAGTPKPMTDAELAALEGRTA